MAGLLQAPPPMSSADTIEAERAERPRGGLAALLGALLTFGGAIVTQVVVLNDFPRVGVLQAVEPALNGRAEATIDPRAVGLEYLDDNRIGLLLAAAASALGALAIGFALLVLLRATHRRREETPKLARFVVIAGPLLIAVCAFGAQVARAIATSDFISTGDRSPAAYDDAVGGGLIVVLSAGALLGQLLLAFAFVVVSLNAMRAGLLTRFLGVLGVIVGVLFVLPIGSPIPVVQVFWLIAFGMVLLGRWPNEPPAWASGEAVPWPTGAQIREQRAAAAERAGRGRRDEPAAPAGHDDVAEPRAVAHPSSKKKKRRRR